MVNRLKSLTSVVILIGSSFILAEDTQPISTKDKITEERERPQSSVIEDSVTHDADSISSITELSNQALVVLLNEINEMESSQQRELLVEIQRRILEVGPEPFIQGRKDAIALSSDDEETYPRLVDETIKVVTTEVREVDTKEFVRDPEKVNLKKTNNSGKKPVPYGSAYGD